MFTFIHYRLLLKALIIIIVVSCGLLIGSTWKVEKSSNDMKSMGEEPIKVENYTLIVDVKDPSVAYAQVGGGRTHMVRFENNFTYSHTENDKFMLKSFSCRVEEWNKVHTDQIPNAELHNQWMSKNISRNNYLFHSSPSPLAAFAHDEHIAVTLSAENMFAKKVYCRYYNCNRHEILKVFPSRVFPESTVYCGRRIGAKYISITENLEDTPEPPVPIQNRVSVVPQHYFTVCMAALYGSEPKFLQIVDFIEYHKLQGATFFHIYLRNASAYDRMLLDDYVKTGEIELIVLNDHYWRADFMWHMMQINDCHMRNTNFAKWTALLDIDERLEMKYGLRVVDYLDSITNPNVVNLQFSVQWVLKDEWSPEKFEDEEQFVENLIFKRFHNTSRVGDYWVQPKSIIRPDRIGAMTIHMPIAVYSGFMKTYVNSTIGVVRHYRNVEGGELTNNNKKVFEMGPYNLTDINEDLEKKLTSACVSRVKQVYDTVLFPCDKMQKMYHLHGLEHPCIHSTTPSSPDQMFI